MYVCHHLRDNNTRHEHDLSLRNEPKLNVSMQIKRSCCTLNFMAIVTYAVVTFDVPVKIRRNSHTIYTYMYIYIYIYIYIWPGPWLLELSKVKYKIIPIENA